MWTSLIANLITAFARFLIKRAIARVHELERKLEKEKRRLLQTHAEHPEENVLQQYFEGRRKTNDDQPNP